MFANQIRTFTCPLRDRYHCVEVSAGMNIRYVDSNVGANLGNAIFWMRDTFKLEKQHDLNYSELIGARAKTEPSRWYFGSPQVESQAF